MYLSRLIVQNYRSISFLNLEFSTGKNIIIGKNNSGKSNVLAAINLLLGDSSPTYNKSQNITETDFHNGILDNPICICCEVRATPSEEFNYAAIKKECAGFHRYSEPITFDSKNATTLFDIQSTVFAVDFDNLQNRYDLSKDFGVCKQYITEKQTNQHDVFYSLFNKDLDGGDRSLKSIIYLFSARYDKENSIIHKDLRIMYKTSSSSNEWILINKFTLRNSLLQSAIIPAIRDTSKQLSLNSYSWYGKLIKYYISLGDKSDYDKAVEVYKEMTQNLFSPISNYFNSEDMNIAYPNTKLKLRCAPSNRDAWKLALLYVDDGFECLLSEKGTGIQSVVIIGLFIHYITKILIRGSALLAIEEPEIFLHPHARRVLSWRLDEFSSETNHQVIITTHSTDFISCQEGINLIRINKVSNGDTCANYYSFKNPTDLRIINTQRNLEVFFADYLIFVEGESDNIILKEIIKIMGINNGMKDYWMDASNISIIPTGGKKEMKTYIRLSSTLKIPSLTICDFDTLFDDDENIVDMINASPISEDTRKSLIDQLKKMKCYIGPSLNDKKWSDIKSINLFDGVEKSQIRDFMDNLLNCGIYVQDGELEDLYTKETITSILQRPTGSRSHKNTDALKIYTHIHNNQDNISDYIHIDSLRNLVLKIKKDIGK